MTRRPTSAKRTARKAPAKKAAAKKPAAPTARPAVAPAPSAKVSQKELAALVGLSTRQIHNLAELGMPREEDGYPMPAALRWYITYKEERAAKGAAPANIEEARERKLVAEARLAEIAVAEKESTLVPGELLESVVGELAERLRAVLINIPSQYGLDLERAGVPAADAQELLEKIADALTLALRATPDELDEDEDGDGEGGATEDDEG